MVFQSYALFPHMTVAENVAYGLTMSGFPKQEVVERAEEGLKLVGLGGYGGRLPSELSGGQQQRVAVARALVLEPAVLLFDEPLSNLDAKLRRRVREDIRELQQKLGLTSVYVTHDQEEALAVSDRIIVMRNAEIAQEGSPRDLYEAPADNFVADFIGDANLVDGEIESLEQNMALVRVGEFSRRLPSRGLAAGLVKVAIRPEAIRIVHNGAPAELQAKVLKATIWAATWSTHWRPRWVSCSPWTRISTTRPRQGRPWRFSWQGAVLPWFAIESQPAQGVVRRMMSRGSMKNEFGTKLSLFSASMILVVARRVSASVS
jgi:iron(III) transport system ATP-binding protein